MRRSVAPRACLYLGHGLPDVHVVVDTNLVQGEAGEQHQAQRLDAIEDVAAWRMREGRRVTLPLSRSRKSGTLGERAQQERQQKRRKRQMLSEHNGREGGICRSVPRSTRSTRMWMRKGRSRPRSRSRRKQGRKDGSLLPLDGGRDKTQGRGAPYPRTSIHRAPSPH